MDSERARTRSVQESWANNVCFGCGQANEEGLQLESYLSADGESLVATFEPEQAHTAGYPTMTYGGLIASLVDCHSLWTAITFAYKRAEGPLLSEPLQMYVTGELTTQYLEPTPVDQPIELEASVEGEVGDTVDVTCTVRADGVVTARGEQTAVKLQDTAPVDAEPIDLHGAPTPG